MTPLLFGILLSTIISAIILAIAIQKRTAPKSHYLIILAFLITIYSVGRAFEASAMSMEASYFGVILSYLSLPYAPLTMLLFLLDYYDIKINKRPLFLLLIPAFITTVLVTVPQLRHYYYSSYTFFPGPPIAQIMVEGTIFYQIFSLFYFATLVVCLVFALWGAVKSEKANRLPIILVSVAVFLPTLFGVLYALHLTPLELEITPVALCFSLGLFGISVYRLNLLRILPIAKDIILEQMDDAFVIVDFENRYVESNAAAKKCFPALLDMQVGQIINVAELFSDMTVGLDGRSLVPILLDGVQQYHHLSKTEIAQNGKALCMCYTLHDVTDTRKLLAELKSIATYDNLTKLYNRGSFYQLATHELDLARKQKIPLSVFAIDIDNFKEINDTYGHFCGDEVMKELVKKIASRLRTSDIFGRVGGDEFNVLLSNTTLENAVTLAQTLQSMVSTELFTYDTRQIPVTISIGVAIFEENRHVNMEHLLIDADSALYESKNTGRNKVCTFFPTK